MLFFVETEHDRIVAGARAKLREHQRSDAERGELRKFQENETEVWRANPSVTAADLCALMFVHRAEAEHHAYAAMERAQ